MAAIVPMVDLWPVAAAFPAEGYRMLYPGSLSLFGFIGFSVLKIPNGWSNPLYLAPLFVSVVLTYGMFWFVWAYFGALIASISTTRMLRARPPISSRPGREPGV